MDHQPLAFIAQLLKRDGVVKSGDLLDQLRQISPKINRASLANLMKKMGGSIVQSGKARSTAYALRKLNNNGVVPKIDVYQVDERGKVELYGELYTLVNDGYLLKTSKPITWPVESGMKDGWFEGIPYLFADMRPQGFLGRNFARNYYQLLQADSDPTNWQDEDVIRALTAYGDDASGNFILGANALSLFREKQRDHYPLVKEADIADAYNMMALSAMSRGTAGSSAAGEFPKFTGYREYRRQQQHVIVKFSGDSVSPEVKRWSDLLISEHNALSVLSSVGGIGTAVSRIIQHGHRTFLEIERFDRHGEFGRSALCSWASVNGALFGLDQLSWLNAADKLLEEGMIDKENAKIIRKIHYFGTLIANTDMHSGNLSFRLNKTSKTRQFVVSPVYDMLPMLYAPVSGVELPQKEFKPALPLLASDEWHEAAKMAQVFWMSNAGDEKIGHDFRKISEENAAKVEALAKLL